MPLDQLPTAPGSYLFTDAIGAPPERLEVVEDAGELCARFEGGDEVVLTPVRNMQGTWAPA
jgi:hypothetical protein